MGRDIASLVRDFFISGYLHPAINATNVVFVPKVPIPTKIGQFRPISICNIVYKVISKIISNRIKLLLADLICPTQNAFVLG